MQAVAVQSSVSIRPLVHADITSLSALAASIWRNYYANNVISAEQVEYMIPLTSSRAAIESHLEKNKAHYLVAELDGALTGYMALEEKLAGEWFIDKLYIDVAQHGQGIGTSLLEYAMANYKPRQLSLRVNRNNIKAINFYFKHGFIIDRLDRLDIGGGFVMDDYIMQRMIGNTRGK